MRNAPATLSLFFGLLSMGTALCCCYGLPWNAIAVVLGVVGLAQAGPTGEGRALAWGGIAAGILSVVEAVALVVLGLAAYAFTLLLALFAAILDAS